MKRIGVVVILLLAFIGLADASYLAQHAASGTPLLCNIENLSGCNTVAQSPYARILGIPIADFGLLFYGALFTLAALELLLRQRFLRHALQAAAAISFLASVYFTYLQVYRIGALCIYCLLSAGISILLVIFASLIEPIPVRRRRPRDHDRAPLDA